MSFFQELLSTPLPVSRIGSVAGLRQWVSAASTIQDTVERAARAGLSAEGVGWAFAGGYESALAKLHPALDARGTLAALCATEQGGGHPRAVRTSLQRSPDGGWVLTGRKSFVTLGADAELLLVVAKTGEDAGGRNILRIAAVPSSRRGVTLEPAAALPFAPEIGHAAARFEAVVVGESEILPGDGYDTVLKPFRTIEDVHVMAALVGWTIGVGRTAGWERDWMEEAIALLLALRAVNREPPLDPGTHVALAGVLAAVRRLLDRAAWPMVDAAIRERWERDRPLLDVASTVRSARRDAAWRAI